jgi:hypothetical protein
MNRINNKQIYKALIAINIVIVLLILFFVVFYIYAINSGIKNPFQYYHLGIYPLLFIFLFGCIRYIFPPCYFEAELLNECIKIKLINSSKYYIVRFIFLLLTNQIKPTEFMIDRVSFTNYRIEISKWGFNKRLILQKSVNGDLFESKPIRIDYLGYKKYTDLIISIERLSQKMSLN